MIIHSLQSISCLMKNQHMYAASVWVSDKILHKPACTVTEACKNLETLDVRIAKTKLSSAVQLQIVGFLV